jgi:Toprim domain
MKAERHATATNRTLSDTELAACQPIQGKGGQVLRAFCPFHGSDHQRSLCVQRDTGRFVCFACGAWGYTEEARQRWQAARQHSSAALRPWNRLRPLQPQDKGDRFSSASYSTPHHSGMAQRPATPPGLAQHLAVFQAALPGSPGEAYLRHRGIPLALAQHAGVGYAAPGQWPHAGRDWKGGRVVFPHTDPDGHLVNLYGRAVSTTTSVPKALRHDHLPGVTGYFNAPALRTGDGPLFVCEGAFDALALMATGSSRAVALFGVQGWRWAWMRTVRALVFALDADAPGQQQWRTLAREAVLRGKQVAVLPAEAYGGYKDVNAAWVAGVLTVGDWPGAFGVVWSAERRELWEERVAIAAWDGGLARPEAERVAWECLPPREGDPRKAAR